ncbi:MAG: YezD family protein [Candidatus Omnitrophica bacterium]|nr:YezD family protein [Candidatus Omnitrophota bacterium]
MAAKPLSPTLLSRIAEAIAGIRYGAVHITIHDSKVVQIEKAEKMRVCREADRTTGGSQPSGPSRPKEDQWNVGLES